MSEASLIGTRIRQRRVTMGLKQAQLAQEAGISASYLNLIEHNRRRIGGKTLIRLADALQIDPATLREGAHRTLLAALQQVADLDQAEASKRSSTDGLPELERVEEFAGRFPGWARLLAATEAKRGDLERTVTLLTERLANDPQLAEALHEVISTVTSIRSAASILAETHDLEPAWQMRFHRNLNEDSARLSLGAEALVRYLEAPPETAARILSPADEVEAFFKAHDYHLPVLEEGLDVAGIDRLTGASDLLGSDEARALAREFLYLCAEDVAAIPQARLGPGPPLAALDPEMLGRTLDEPLPRILRRVALLPEERMGPTGFVMMDTTGAILLRKPVLGLLPPRSGVGCALWPLREALAAPGRPIQSRLRHDGNGLRTYTISEQIRPAGFDSPGLRRAYMLLVPDIGRAGRAAPQPMAEPCLICGQTSCPVAI
ncbi:MAG: helix-turn-helix domain-containing protein [Pseudomonadota bacterium]